MNLSRLFPVAHAHMPFQSRRNSWVSPLPGAPCLSSPLHHCPKPRARHFSAQNKFFPGHPSVPMEKGGSHGLSQLGHHLPASCMVSMIKGRRLATQARFSPAFRLLLKFCFCSKEMPQIGFRQTASLLSVLHKWLQARLCQQIKGPTF